MAELKIVWHDNWPFPSSFAERNPVGAHGPNICELGCGWLCKSRATFFRQLCLLSHKASRYFELLLHESDSPFRRVSSHAIPFLHDLEESSHVLSLTSSSKIARHGLSHNPWREPARLLSHCLASLSSLSILILPRRRHTPPP